MSVGTLLWIGPRDSRELRPIFQDCESRASQLALRHDLDDAWWRRADQVQSIVIAHQSREQLCHSSTATITARYDCKNTWEILSPLCAGLRQNTGEHQRIYWHQWNQFADLIVADSSPQFLQSPQQADSVLVVAQSIDNAEPMMELAAAHAKTVVWCRNPTSIRAKNFDVVWWDDSLATPASCRTWQNRIGVFQHAGNPPLKHVWITNDMTARHIQAAKDGGITCVLTKPLQIGSLLQTIHPQNSCALDQQEELFEPIVRAA